MGDVPSIKMLKWHSCPKCIDKICFYGYLLGEFPLNCTKNSSYSKNQLPYNKWDHSQSHVEVLKATIYYIVGKTCQFGFFSWQIIYVNGQMSTFCAHWCTKGPLFPLEWNSKHAWDRWDRMKSIQNHKGWLKRIMIYYEILKW